MNETTTLPQAIELGTKVQLKNGAFGDVKIRKWEFSGIEKRKIILYRREGLILEARMEDINWEGLNGSKVED
jgi:hypothetical protein